MSTATLERPTAANSAEWGEWKVGDDGIGERRHVVYRERASGSGPSFEWHSSPGRKATKYTLAGAVKKAQELNRDVADAKRRDEWLAKREAEQKAQQDMARMVREVAACGTQNSEAIARWIIGNFTWTDEADELRATAREALESVNYEREAAKQAEKALEASLKRCDDLAAEARELLTELGAYGAPRVSDPLAYAVGSTPLERVVDMSRNLIAALEEYEHGAR